MASFDSGVKAYITGECRIKIHFPVDFKDNADVSCYQCKIFSRNNGICQLTKVISEFPTKFIGSCCPLEFDGEIKEIKQKGEKQNEED
jgi:hypothetical protein